MENCLPLYEKKEKAQIYYNLGWYYYLENQIDKAIYASEDSLKLAKDDIDLVGAYFNNSLFKFIKGNDESGWNWFFYSLNLSFKRDSEGRKSLLVSVIPDFENLRKKAKEIKSKTLAANADTALWFLYKVNEEPIPKSMNLLKNLSFSRIQKAMSQSPFETSINPELKYLLAAYSSKVENFKEADLTLESLCKEHGYSHYEKSKQEKDFSYYQETATKNQKGFYQREEAKRKKVRLIVQNGHSDVIYSVAFSPDGKKYLSGSGDNTMKLWDVSGKLLHTFEGHSDWVTSVAFSPDGKSVISASKDKSVKIWDLTGNMIQSFEVEGSNYGLGSLPMVAYSPNGKQILSISRPIANDSVVKVIIKKIKLYNLSGKFLLDFEAHSSDINTVAFSPDGKSILSGSDDKTMKLWDISGKLLQKFEGHSESVNSVAFSPDGKRIISGSKDNTIKIWDLSGKLLYTYEGHSGSVTSVVFSPNGKQLLSSSKDKTMKLWDLSGKLLYTYEGHSDSVNSLAFNPSGKQFLSGSDNKTMKLWDLQGKVLQGFEGHSFSVTSAAFSPDRKKILATDNKKIQLWDSSGKFLQSIDGHSDGISNVVFSPEGNQILSAGKTSFSNPSSIYYFSRSEHSLRLLDLTGKLLTNFSGLRNTINSIAFSPDGKQILSGSEDKTIRLWDVSGKLLNTITGHTESINSVVFNPDGNYILSGSEDKSIKLWDLSGKLLYTYNIYDSCASITFSPDGKQFISTEKALSKNPRDQLSSVLKSMFRINFDDNVIKLWDISGKLLHKFEGHTGVVNSLTFSPDGKQILSGSTDNTIKLWDISGKLLHTFKGHTSAVNSVAFSHDGKFIISGSSDTTIKIWDVEKRALVATLIAFKDGEGLVYTPDGKFDYTSAKANLNKKSLGGNEFIDLSDMFNHFYEPGLLEKVLAGDATKGKQESMGLDEKFKDRPVIKVKNIDPQKKIKAEDNKKNLRFSVKDQGSGISDVMVFVNGHLLSSNWKDFSEDLKVDVPLVSGVNKVEIKAYNKDNIPITYTMELTKEAASNEVLDKPDLYLLAVGINEYKESKLKFSVNDAKVFSSVIEKKSKGLFGNVIVKSLLDKDASKRNIKEAISEIKQNAKAKDVVMLYFSGHGNTAIKTNPLPGENPKLFYFVPADFGWGDTNMDSEIVAQNQGVDADYINKSISAMLSHKVVLILDACQSGDVQVAMRSGNKTKLARQQMERLANGTGRFILTSSAGNELSREIASLGHGVFTYVLLQALEEADNDKSGDISLREIGRYIEDKFEEKTKPYLKDIIQSPSPLIQLGRDSASARVNDFPLVRSK